MAHKKAGGSTRNGRDSESKRLGVKKFGGEHVVGGNIILRQRGTQYHAGVNVGLGKDHTIFATAEGKVEFNQRGPKNRTFVDVVAGDRQPPRAADRRRGVPGRFAGSARRKTDLLDRRVGEAGRRRQDRAV